MMSKIAIIGSGFSGLSAAAVLSKQGHIVTVYEKNDELGGRARQFKANGYTFDMGPSWSALKPIPNTSLGNST
ncbi:MAG: hypothetical protein CMB32_01510 [Euryarchaeota archaeon]|nr:hypothetical protein [Euryarchaeota archaeon]